MPENHQESIVLELQRLATDRSNNIADLLRKAMLVATKLKLQDFHRWTNNELHGYQEDEVPKYRHLSCALRAVNPFHGLIPLHVPPDLAKKICNIDYRGSIGSVVGILERRQEEDRTPPMMPFSDHQKAWLMRSMSGPAMEPVRLVSENQLEAIIDSVRTTILEWALSLEAEGILGEGLTFSEKEKQRAAASHQINIGNFQGILGDVTDSTISQNFRMTIRPHDFESMREFLAAKEIGESDLADLKHAIQSDPPPRVAAQFGSNVSEWIGRMVGKAASGTWKIGIAVAGNLLTEALTAYYGLGK